MVLSGECCSSHLGTEVSLPHLLRQHIYCSSGTYTELLLLPGSRDWLVLLMTWLALFTSTCHPTFIVSDFLPVFHSLSPCSNFLSCAFWSIVLFFDTIPSSFYLFSLSTGPRATSNNGILKSVTVISEI